MLEKLGMRLGSDQAHAEQAYNWLRTGTYCTCTLSAMYLVRKHEYLLVLCE